MPGLVPVLTLNGALDHDNGALIFALMYFLAIVALANLNRVIGQLQQEYPFRLQMGVTTLHALFNLLFVGNKNKDRTQGKNRIISAINRIVSACVVRNQVCLL